MSFANVNNFVGAMSSEREGFFRFTTKNLHGRGIPYVARGEMSLFVEGRMRFAEKPQNLRFTLDSVLWDGASKVDVLIGTSYIDTDQARLNLEQEVNTNTFEELVEEANAEWNELLGELLSFVCSEL